MEPQKCMEDCGMIKKGEHMIKVESAAETGERAWLEENDQFWWPTLSTPFYHAASYNVLPGKGERKYLINNSETWIRYTFHGHTQDNSLQGILSNAAFEHCALSRAGWFQLEGQVLKFKSTQVPVLCLSPHVQEAEAVHWPLKWAWREHLHPTVLGPEINWEKCRVSVYDYNHTPWVCKYNITLIYMLYFYIL